MYELKVARTKAHGMAAEYAYSQPASFLVCSIYKHVLLVRSFYLVPYLARLRERCLLKTPSSSEISWKLHDPVTILSQAYKRRSKTTKRSGNGGADAPRYGGRSTGDICVRRTSAYEDKYVSER
jgi:hypothetical protein